MGYDAFVHCRCYQDDKIPRPYFAQFIVYDDDGISLHLPAHIQQDVEQADIIDRDFEDWRAHACEHEDMCLCSERVANISGMAQFRSFIHKHQDNHPVLHQYLPTANGGIVPAQFAQSLHDELTLIKRCQNDINIHHLINTDNGDIIASSHNDDFTLFMLTPDAEFYVGRHGLIISDKQDNVLFTSAHFTQHHIADDGYIFNDINTHKKYNSTYGITDTDAQFKITQAQIKVSDQFAYIITPLIKLAQASIQTGNPIHWF